MRPTWLWTVVLPVSIAAACAAGEGRGGSDDDDDDDSSGGFTSAGGAGGTTSTPTTSTTTTTDTSTTTTSSTSSSTSTASCYAGHGDCDPLQPGSCSTAGAACEIDGGSSQFVCFDPPNTATLGSPCDPTSGPYCMHGLTCVSTGDASVCAAYCCSEADCASCASIGTVGTIDVKVCPL